LFFETRTRPPLFHDAIIVAPIPEDRVAVVALLVRVNHAVAAHVTRRVAQVTGVAVDANARRVAAETDAARASS
jgi:hypothetical protein